MQGTLTPQAQAERAGEDQLIDLAGRLEGLGFVVELSEDHIAVELDTHHARVEVRVDDLERRALEVRSELTLVQGMTTGEALHRIVWWSKDRPRRSLREYLFRIREQANGKPRKRKAAEVWDRGPLPTTPFKKAHR